MRTSNRTSPPPSPIVPFLTRTDERGEGPSRLNLSPLSPGMPSPSWPSAASAASAVASVASVAAAAAGRVVSAGSNSGPRSALLGLGLGRPRSASAGYTKVRTRSDRSARSDRGARSDGGESSSDESTFSAYTADDRSDTSRRSSMGRSSIGLNDEGEFELEDGLLFDDAEPLVARRRKKKWDDEPGNKSLFELVAPLVLAHPLALFPLLSNVSTEFLPAGVALFVPLFCVLAVLSACAHIVIVYLAWYLKVRTFEDVFAACVGERFGRYGLGVGRAFVLVATMGATVGWLGSVYTYLEPIITQYLPHGFLSARITWTILSGLFLTPIVVPSRTLRTLRIAPVVIATLLPIVAFLIIGRTVEITKAAEEAGHALVSAAASASAEAAGKTAPAIAKRGLRGLVTGSAGSGLTTLVMFFTPHLLTLDLHATLARTHRQQFGAPCLGAGLIIILLALPAALVPYYLFPEGPSAFTHLPATDGWANTARVMMCIIILGSITMWLLRGRDTILAALDVDGGAERRKASRWVGAGMWTILVAVACIGGWVADKIELLGVMATIAVGWLLPSVFFIITFHVRSPLAIIFPSHAPPPPVDDGDSTAALPSRSRANGHLRTPSLQDPTADVLLARKERQLQKRRLGRRLWQDLIVYVGILPVGCVSLVWCVVSFVGVW